MSRIMVGVARRLVSILVFASVAGAQREPRVTERAPVPAQVLNARAVFVGNGGGDTYGADSYFHLTKYDGGPNRAYHSFYNAVSEWGHYELVGSTADADVLLVVRFANPVVDRDSPSTSGDVPHDWIYDPQLNLSINDPRSGLPLWTITEHIEPGDNRAEDNRHFDEAVIRLVADLQRLILNPNALPEAENALPPGAIRAATQRRRTQHAFIGGMLGSLAGGVIGSRMGNVACPDNPPLNLQPPPLPPFPTLPFQQPDPSTLMPPNNFSCLEHRSKLQMQNAIIGTLGGAIVGGIIGWIWPVSF